MNCQANSIRDAGLNSEPEVDQSQQQITESTFLRPARFDDLVNRFRNNEVSVERTPAFYDNILTKACGQVLVRPGYCTEKLTYFVYFVKYNSLGPTEAQKTTFMQCSYLELDEFISILEKSIKELKEHKIGTQLARLFGSPYGAVTERTDKNFFAESHTDYIGSKTLWVRPYVDKQGLSSVVLWMPRQNGAAAGLQYQNWIGRTMSFNLKVCQEFVGHLKQMKEWITSEINAEPLEASMN